MKKIVIICVGDFAKEVAWLIEDINANNPVYELLGFLDDDEKNIGKNINGYKCIGKIDLLLKLAKEETVYATIATQRSSYRKKIVEENPDFCNWETLIHPSANISNSVKLGFGCIVCANCNISVDATIGNHCILNLGATVGHDCEINDYVSIMSGTVISGHVKAGESAYFGSNSTVLPGMKIGMNSKIGAGSVVIRNVKDGVTVMGVPARVIAL